MPTIIGNKWNLLIGVSWSRVLPILKISMLAIWDAHFSLVGLEMGIGTDSREHHFVQLGAHDGAPLSGPRLCRWY